MSARLPSRFRRKRASTAAVDERTVLMLYKRLLGRKPVPEELENQGRAASLEALVATIVGSEEFAQYHRESNAPVTPAQRFVNTHHPDHARWEHQPGTWSADGVGVVGRDGWLFIGGGTNANLAQFTGHAEMSDTWLDGWREVVATRVADAAELGVSLTSVVVPDKLAIQEEFFPESLERAGPRPIERLTGEAGLPLLYPLDVLRRARAQEDVCLRTDSHLTPWGYHLIHRETLRELDALDALVELPPLEYEKLQSGDLGVRFTPAVVEVFRLVGNLGAATITEDNWPEVHAAGGHLGTRRVFTNPDARDQRTVVVFGDSYGFGDAGSHGLSWMLSQSFATVHFVWVPCGWDPDYVQKAGAQLVVSQTAERFMSRVPLPRVSVEALMARWREEQAPISPETIFGDEPTDS